MRFFFLGARITIYDLPGFAKSAQEAVFTTANIQNAFRKTGIEPFDDNIFTDEDFGGSFATERPPPMLESVGQTSNENAVNVQSVESLPSFMKLVMDPGE
jgi:hypothetical protein